MSSNYLTAYMKNISKIADNLQIYIIDLPNS